MKYVDTMITFSEVPDEISLCINISNCKLHCKNCHSKYLWDDIGEELTTDVLTKLIEHNKDFITCVCLLGGEPVDIRSIVLFIRDKYPKLKIAWYTGLDKVDMSIFDYVKTGPYIEERGGLSNPNTNQRLYLIRQDEVVDITNKFWK